MLPSWPRRNRRVSGRLDQTKHGLATLTSAGLGFGRSRPIALISVLPIGCRFTRGRAPTRIFRRSDKPRSGIADIQACKVVVLCVPIPGSCTAASVARRCRSDAPGNGADELPRPPTRRSGSRARRCFRTSLNAECLQFTAREGERRGGPGHTSGYCDCDCNDEHTHCSCPPLSCPAGPQSTPQPGPRRRATALYPIMKRPSSAERS
jgi:hypothetical protein